MLRDNLLCILIFSLFINLPAAHGQSANEWLQKARSLRMTNLDSSNWYATQAYKTALETNDPEVVLKAEFLLGKNLQMQGKFDEAVGVYKQVLASTPSGTYPEEYIQAYGRIGDCYTDLGTFDSAMVYLTSFDQLVDEHWSPDKIDAKLLLGELYRAIGRINKSDDYKIEAIERAERSGNKMERTIALYYYLDDHKSEMYTEDFQKYFQEYIQLMNAQSSAHMDFSHANILLQDLNDQEKIVRLETAIEKASNMGYHSTILYFRAALIEIYLERNLFMQALVHAEQGLQTTSNVDDKRYRADFNQYLFRIHQELKNYEQAIHYLQTFHLIKDSLEDINLSKNIEELNIQYQTAERERNLLEQQLTVDQRTNQRNGLLLLAGFLGSLILFVYLFQRQRIRNNHLIAQQESAVQTQRIQQLESEKKLLAMSSMIEGQEVERLRIARDLHDGLGGLLGTLKAHFNTIQREIRELESINVYDKVNDLIDSASSEVRRISHNMVPHALQMLGLHDALQDFCDQSQTKEINVQFEWSGSRNRLPENQEIMIYRIAQELINNAIKYGQPHNVLVQINRFEYELNLIVEDDGTGFDFEEAIQKGGLGLKSIQSRVKYLNGMLDVISAPDEGTSFSIQVPLSNLEM